MRQEDLLKEKYTTDTGFRVPDGYFDTLRESVMESLPAYPEAEKLQRLNPWQRIKPYVYLAAMFAGIWLMMNMFNHISKVGSLNLDNPPEAIADAIAVVYDDHEAIPYFTTATDCALEEDITDSYDSIDDFETDFGYEISPEYDSMCLPASADKGGVRS